MRQCLLVCLFLLVAIIDYGQPFKGNWIVVNDESKTAPNTWYCFRKNIVLKNVPKDVRVRIATDTKYWLWVNGQLTVYEGGLKRGPDPNNTYYDVVDIAAQLKKGKNTIAILVWFWGGKGFSHNNSGRMALYVDCLSDKVVLQSDKSWKAIQYKAYGSPAVSKPNFRLSEPTIFFDAAKKIDKWFSPDYREDGWKNAVETGTPPVVPWNHLIQRNIPLFRFDPLKSYTGIKWKGDTMICRLPYNGQFSPYLKLRAKGRRRIFIATDTYFLGAYPNDSLYTLCSEYISANGVQEYESLLWLSGHEMRYVIPKDVEVLSVKYRESGYAANFTGSFHCDDPLLNVLWQKAQRTLYVNMRDNYMDCPDRERAQWAGDAAMEMAQAFYALDRRSDLLSRKLFLDLANWQRADSTIYNPVPENDWKNELPVHSLMPLSELWRYFLFTKDTATVRYVYPALKKYLGVWTIQPNGQLIYRKGGWDWGDWGNNKDFVLIQHGWYLLATQTAAKIALLFNEEADYKAFDKNEKLLKSFLNSPDCWNGKEYRYREYKEETDDRANALMVIAGVADSTKWPFISEVLKKQENASPWMEKFVLESLIKMRQPGFALERMKKRYKNMVESPFSTLWEIWEYREGEVHGNSGYNHGWAGGPLVLLSQYYAGITPDETRKNSYIIRPVVPGLKELRAVLPTAKGKLVVSVEAKKDAVKLSCSVPTGLIVLIGLPKPVPSVTTITCNNIAVTKLKNIKLMGEDEQYYWMEVEGGSYHFFAK